MIDEKTILNKQYNDLDEKIRDIALRVEKLESISKYFLEHLNKENDKKPK